MGKERVNSESSYLKVLKGLISKGEVGREVIEEFASGVGEGRINISFSDTIAVWRVARRRNGIADLFLPKGYSPSQAEAEAIDVLVDTLSKTRGLPGPRLREMDELRDRLKEELTQIAS